jgi:protein-S-isoprenylcysteine O-methyltransferase Ste14
VYGHVRHPFYFAYTLTWIAGYVAAQSVWTIGSAALMFAGYWRAAVVEEEKLSRSLLRTQYAVFRKQAGLFLPIV